MTVNLSHYQQKPLESNQSWSIPYRFCLFLRFATYLPVLSLNALKLFTLKVAQKTCAQLS
jgi:hypothetical protein